MDSRHLFVFRRIPTKLSSFFSLSSWRRVFSLSPFDANISDSSRYIPSIHLALSLSMTSNGFSSVLEPKCSYSYKDIRCRSEKCCRGIPLVPRQCASLTVKERSSLPMHIFALQRMIIFPAGKYPLVLVNEMASPCNHRQNVSRLPGK